MTQDMYSGFPTVGKLLKNKLKRGSKRDKRRSFTSTQKKEILYQQNNRCASARCHKPLDPRAIEFDHKKPWAAGGRTITVNGRALCADCHKIITHESRLRRVDKPRISPKQRSYLPEIKLPEF